jgi:hypothetical protein
MDASELWRLLDAIEARIPLERDGLEGLFETTFATDVDHNRQPILVAKTPRHALELRLPKGPAPGELTVRFAHPVSLDPDAVHGRFPGGSSLPPPPPGYGPSEAQGIYVADRPWGQIWFAFHTGNRLVQLSIAPGRYGSPGV